MAREHARVKLSIWDDDDFRELSPSAQHLYFALLIHPTLNYAGMADWRPSRLAGFAAAWTVRTIELAAQELSEARFIIIDNETEEVLLRSFVRNDELMEQPNMAVAMAKAHRSISSAALRGIVVHELRRLHKDKPDLKGWAKVSELLDRATFDPSDYPSFRPSDNPSGTASVYPSGTDEPKPPHSPSVQPSPTTAPNSQLPTPNSQLPKNEDQDLGGERTETLHSPTATKPAPDEASPTRPGDARCTAHRGVADPGPCNGCRIARERAERKADADDERVAREHEARRLACTQCDGTWVVDDEQRPTRRKCDHRRSA